MRAIRYGRLLAAAGMLVLMASIGVSQRVMAHDEDDNTIMGSWDISINTPPQAHLPPLKILRTVSAEGVVDGYAFPPITPTPGALVNSSGHGSWKRIGNRKYSVTVKYFQLNPANNASFAVLDSIGTVRETVTLSKDGKSYTSQFVTEVKAADGTWTIPNQGTTTATRIEVDPL